MTLREQQSLFACFVGELLAEAARLGYHVTLGEVYRPPETAKIYAATGKGVSPSVHELRLALDIQLFDKSGRWLKDTESYRKLGDYWKTLHPQCRWGGDFNRRDGGHFSMAWGNLA